MTEDLIILGTGVHAAEMADIVGRINNVEPRWRLRGFIRRATDPGVDCWAGLPVLGNVDALPDYPDCHVAHECFFDDRIDVPPERWAALVDPSSFVASSAVVGPGSVVYPHGFIGAGATLTQRAFILSGCAINHDCVLEDRTIVCSGVTLAGHVHVERDCYLGQRCTVRQNVRIGAGSTLGMGSVVLDDVPPEVVMVGNPARKLRDKRV